VKTPSPYNPFDAAISSASLSFVYTHFTHSLPVILVSFASVARLSRVVSPRVAAFQSQTHADVN
jgi:hypothetical protein